MTDATENLMNGTAVELTNITDTSTTAVEDTATSPPVEAAPPPEPSPETTAAGATYVERFISNARSLAAQAGLDPVSASAAPAEHPENKLWQEIICAAMTMASGESS
jgi:hypothetical protein